MDARDRVIENFNESIRIIQESSDALALGIESAANLITQAILDEKKVLTCGNGGSSADAQRFTAIMLNRYELPRPGLPSIALNANSTTLTAIANDFQFADVFSKQLRALAQSGDILLAITSGGESHNIIHAIDAAHDRNVTVIALTGRDGGQVTDNLDANDIEIRVPSWSTSIIKEIQLMIIHNICDLIDRQLLGQQT